MSVCDYLINCTQNFAYEEFPFLKIHFSEEMHLMRFRNAREGQQYDVELTKIKRTIATLNSDKDDLETITQQIYEDNLRNLWIPMVDKFIHKWCEIRVTVDVQRAYDNVREGIGMKPKKWSWTKRNKVKASPAMKQHLVLISLVAMVPYQNIISSSDGG